jgi:class 3 adenylate cyclase
VTGLPDPMPNHASVLAQFTVACSKKTEEMQKKNPNWANGMQFRFGIHSGPIIAGILRGQKSRFELFGDTINTASRMESTGKPERIQVSPDTAELLRDEGMESWLVPRKDLVEVKGKGALSTFWLIPNDRIQGKRRSWLQ